MDKSTNTMDPQSPNPPLRRELGLLEVTLSGVGIILGAGVYVLIGQAAGLAGNAIWLAFGISAIIALLTGLSYAELSSMFPKAGAEYDYVKNAFNAQLAFVIGWLVFLSGVLAAATVALGFAGYFSALTSIPVLISAIVLLIVLTALLVYGVKETARAAVIATLIEVSGLVIIIAIGLPHLGSVNYWEMPQGYSGLFAASALIFFAYQGFESMVKFSEETKKPEITVPKALILALTISVILYVLVALSVVSVIGWQQLAVSNAPFADVASVSLGPNAAVIIAIVALFATANTALMSMYASSRILYGMAGSSDLTARLALVHPVRRTPWIAILVCGVLSLMLIFAGDIAFIANVTNFTLFLTFMVINAAVIVLRYHSPRTPRPFRIPYSIGRLPLVPVAGIVFCIFLLGVQDLAVLTFGLVLTGIGVVLMIIIGHYPSRKV
jgi:APA family basic amino acid/polyamine antiporter